MWVSVQLELEWQERCDAALKEQKVKLEEVITRLQNQVPCLEVVHGQMSVYPSLCSLVLELIIIIIISLLSLFILCRMQN